MCVLLFVFLCFTLFSEWESENWKIEQIPSLNAPNNDFKLGLVKPAFISRHPTVYLSLVFITQGKFFISHTTIIETFHFFRVLFYCFDCNPTQFAPVTTPHHPPIIVVMQNSDLVENWTTLKKGMEEKIDLPQVDLTSRVRKSQGQGRAQAKTFRKSRKKTDNHEFRIYLVNDK